MPTRIFRNLIEKLMTYIRGEDTTVTNHLQMNYRPRKINGFSLNSTDKYSFRDYIATFAAMGIFYTEHNLNLYQNIQVSVNNNAALNSCCSPIYIACSVIFDSYFK